MPPQPPDSRSTPPLSPSATAPGALSGAGDFTDEAWVSVLSAVDRTYADLIAHQEQLERQNEELHDMQRFIVSIMESVNEIMAVVDREGRMEEVSASLAGLTRVDKTALVGRAVADLFAPEGAQLLAQALQDLRLSRNVALFEADLITPDGPAPFEIALSARVNDHNRLIGAVLVGRPLGELRQAYSDLARSHQQLQDAQSQLVRNEKLASLGRLLAGVAHELNNPISFVYANAHALEKYLGRFETYFDRVQAGADRAELVHLREELKLERNLRNLREAIQGARDGAERVRDIVADLRRLSAEGSGTQASFDLVETARIAANWVERGSKTGITPQITGVPALLVTGTPGHIQQIVMNLVQNAMDAVRGLEDPQVHLSITREGDTAVLEVRDSGPGVADENRDAIFDPFFTTKPVGQGTGLGLSISHKIAEEHGGSLTLGPGPGGCFRLELPIGGKARP
ncbi:sensor histidine kinase [Pseudooceanicola nitratireducens]|nr:ATP-binding protein [Pseudooceanicola nitratireducens]